MPEKETGEQTGAGIQTLDSQPTAEPVVEIELSSLVGDDGEFRTVQVRERLNQETVTAYAAAMERGDVFPPIFVYEVTDREGVRYLSGGLHRSSAARQAGRTSIQGYLRQGTWHEALEAAITTNAKHGHRPTLGDVCATLRQMHDDPNYRDMSNVKKAKLIGVSDGTVGNALKRLEATSQITRSETRTVTRQEGTTYQLPVAKAKATSQVTRSEQPGGASAMMDATTAAAAAAVLQSVAEDAAAIVKRLREAGLDCAIVPVDVMTAYREGRDAATLKGEAQTFKAAAHLLGTLQGVPVGKVA